MQKILVIGTGLISDYILKNNPKDVLYSIVSWRNLSSRFLKKKLNDFKPSKVILLGFNKKSFLLNIPLTLKFIVAIKFSNYDGIIIFMNTRNLSSDLYRFQNTLSTSYSEYLLVKFIQSFLLRKLFNNLYEIFVPPVTNQNIDRYKYFSSIDDNDQLSRKDFFIEIKDLQKILINLKKEENHLKLIFPYSGYIKKVKNKRSEKIISRKINWQIYLKGYLLSFINLIKMFVRDIMKHLKCSISKKEITFKSNFYQVNSEEDIFNDDRAFSLLKESINKNEIKPYNCNLRINKK